MATLLWLLLSVGIGYWIGEEYFTAPWEGALCGLIVGLLVRFGARGVDGADFLGDLGGDD